MLIIPLEPGSPFKQNWAGSAPVGHSQNWGKPPQRGPPPKKWSQRFLQRINKQQKHSVSAVNQYEKKNAVRVGGLLRIPKRWRPTPSEFHKGNHLNSTREGSSLTPPENPRCGAPLRGSQPFQQRISNHKNEIGFSSESIKTSRGSPEHPLK